MNFYIVLGSNRHPIANALFTQSDIEGMQIKPDWAVVPIEVPWQNAVWNQTGGRGKSAYPAEMEVTTMRVPESIALQVKQYSVWLAQQQ